MKELIVLLILLVLSAVFSGSETALISISKARAEALLKEGRRGAKALFKLKSDTSHMLITILIGNNLVNIAAASIATVLATEYFGDLGPGLAVGALTLLILIFGEITPKSLATRYSEKISLSIAPFMLGLMRMLYPVVWSLGRFTAWVHSHSGMERDPTITESELIRMAGHGEAEGTIEQGERELIERVFAFNDLTAHDVMTPRNIVYALEGTTTVEQALPEVMKQSYSRIPIYMGQPDEIRSVLYLRDLLEAAAEGKTDAQLKDIAHEAVFIPEYQPINELFAMLRKKQRHMAVVVDEYGTIRGIATLEDLMEELVGEIYDESDSAPEELSQVTQDTIQVAGTAEIRVVEEYFGIDLPGKPTDTISYWILSHAERIPKSGEQFVSDGLKVKVDKASSRRIDRLTISLIDEATHDDYGDAG